MEWMEKKLEGIREKVIKDKDGNYIMWRRRLWGAFFGDRERDEEILEECQRMVDEARERILNAEKQQNHSA